MLNYELYENCFSSAAMRAVWSERATLHAWMLVEKTLAKHQAEVGLISPLAAAAIVDTSEEAFEMRHLQQQMLLVGRPIVGLLQQWRAQLGEHAAALHYRATTQDIMDTAMAWQMRSGAAQIQTEINVSIARLEWHIQQQRKTVILGRTNGQHAVPLKLAVKLGVWKAELERRLEALLQAQVRGLNVQFGGPVGDLSAYESELGQRLKTQMAQTLGLGTIDPHWQNARDGVADVLSALGGLCGTICKIAHNLNLLASSDIAEVHEACEPGRGASSSMAHKRNQRASEFATAVARLGRQRAEQIGELTLHEHERSGGVWIAEWLVVPETFLLTSGALHWLNQLLVTLVIDQKAMQRKVDHCSSVR